MAACSAITPPFLETVTQGVSASINDTQQVATKSQLVPQGKNFSHHQRRQRAAITVEYGKDH